MCSDFWDAANTAIGEAEGVQREGSYEKGRVEVKDWNQEWGGLFKGFEEVSSGDENATQCRGELD